VKVNVEIQNAKPEHKEKLIEAAKLAGEVLSSPSFNSAVLNFSYSYTYRVSFWRRIYKTEVVQGFYQANGMSNQDILNTINLGDELQNGNKDGEVDVIINVQYPGKRGVLGWTYPDVIQQYISGWFLDDATVPELVGNLVHEWLHKIGFDHDYRATSLRPYSVPYAIGDIAEKIARELYAVHHT